jgi:hypothetical protein
MGTWGGCWQLSAPGFEVGPHDEAAVVAAIERGDLRVGQCRRLGETKWRRLNEEPIFAEAIRRSSGAIPLRRR